MVPSSVPVVACEKTRLAVQVSRIKHRVMLFSSLSETDHVGKQPVRPWNTGRKLAIKCVSGIRERSFSVASLQHASFLRRLLTIVALEQRFIFGTPLAHEFRSALFDPAVEIGCRNLIRSRED